MQYAFLGGGGGIIKKYKLPEGEFCHNMIQQQPGIVNSLAISPEDVVVSGADDGSLWCAPRCFPQSLNYLFIKRDPENSPDYSEFLYLCRNHWCCSQTLLQSHETIACWH